MRHITGGRLAHAAAGLAAIAIAAAAHGGTVLYVDDDAPPGGDGLRWSTAYSFLQDALAHAGASGGAVNEIRVAQGTYQPDRDALSPLGTGDRAATFQLISGIALLGGYAGFGAPDPDARDIALYETILTGDLLGDDQPGFVGYGENSWHVVTGSDTNASAVLEAFTITAGNANDLDAPPRGAGILNVKGDPTVTSCVIARNRASANCALFPCGIGGGMFNSESSSTVTGCLFIGNSADWAGGGMFNVESSLVIVDCVFDANQVEGENGFFGGGGILNSGGSLIMDRCTLTSSTAIRGGGIHNWGGSLFLTACTFDENTASDDGGAVRNLDGVLIATDCSFAANTAGLNGGAIFNDGTGKCSLSDSRFRGNAAGYGGGLYGESGALNVTGCSFIGNAAIYSGGGVFSPVEDVARIGTSFFCENTPT
ncbi:MAG: hypothetical protein ACYTGG_08445, partial [Planctomycetota bacterium]